MHSRSRRSALYLPASNLKAIAKSRVLDCDVVILDLEDAVAPEAKTDARNHAVAAIREGGFGSREVVVRVNGLATPWGKEDMQAFGTVTPDAILVPKVSDPTDIAAYSDLLTSTCVPLWAMIETAMSLFRLEQIASAAHTNRLAALVMGTNDLAKETGARVDAARSPFLGALGLAVAAARAHGLAILDGVFNNLDDEPGFVFEAKQAVTFGFDGKTLIHPSQIAPCNMVFTPDAAEIASARLICEAFNAPENADKGAIRLEGRMVERLHLVHARRILAVAGITI